MKRLAVLSLLLVFIFAACKKDKNEDNIDQSDCNESTFQIYLDVEGLFVIDLCEDLDGNIIILGKTNENTKLIKLDTIGGLIWETDIENTFKPVEVITLNDNSIVLLRKSDPSINYCEVLYDFAWVQAGIYPEYNCIPIYELGEPMCYTYDAEIEIMKYDQHGNQLWSKILPDFYAGGNSLLVDDDNNLVLMTAHMYGYQPEYVMDNGIFLDTVNYPRERNRLNIYSISESGDIKWTTYIDGLNNISWLDHFYPGISMDRVDDKIIIKAYDEFITLNYNGQLHNRFKYIPEHCYSELYYMFGMENEYYLISGMYRDWSTGEEIPYAYTELRTMGHEVVWHKDIVSWIIDANSESYITYEPGGGFITCYNQDGSMKWKRKYENTNCAKISCAGGAIISSYDQFQVMVTKINSSGEL